MKDTNPYLLGRLLAIQKSLMAQHAGGAGLPAAQAGSKRETFLREFLQKVFPLHRRFATGSITDSEGTRSGQVDIAVEYGFMPSFPMPSTTDRLLLAESVALVIEVKSDLATQWGQVEDTVSKVKKLRRQMNTVMCLGEGPKEQIPVVAVGYTGHKTVNGLKKRLSDTEVNSRPEAALIIESGCFDGFGIRADGPLGLFALCLIINDIVNSLGYAAPSLLSYVRRESDV